MASFRLAQLLSRPDTVDLRLPDFDVNGIDEHLRHPADPFVVSIKPNHPVENPRSGVDRDGLSRRVPDSDVDLLTLGATQE